VNDPTSRPAASAAPSPRSGSGAGSGAGVELGVVEGFYGLPWSHHARLRVCRFAASEGVRTFIWAPKNDPAHRDAWEERPAVRHLAQVAELAGDAARVGSRWVYGISPVLQRGRTSRDAGAICRRLAPVQKVGVRAFMVAFDDTWPTFVPRFASEALGAAHGEVARAVADDMRGRDAGCEVLVVPAVYAGRASELPPGGIAYLRGLARAAGDLRVAWTGPRIFSPWIAGSDVAALEAATGLRLWIWTNAVANDWLPLVTGSGFGLRGVERISGGPLANLAADLAEPGRLIVVNGAREAHLTLPHVASLAAWGADPRGYDADRALRAGLDRAFGPRLAPTVGLLFDACARHALGAPARLDLRELDEAVAALAATEPGDARVASADAVRRVLSRLEALRGALDAGTDDDALRFEVAGAARKISLLAQAATVAVDLLSAEAPLDRARTRADRASMRSLLRAAASIRWDVGEAPFRRVVMLAQRS
jgi:hyaluronoglucosaminidase